MLLLLWFDDIFICCVIYGSEIFCFAKLKELFGLVVVAVKKFFSEISECCCWHHQKKSRQPAIVSFDEIFVVSK